jgi:hypothetical protein
MVTTETVNLAEHYAGEALGIAWPAGTAPHVIGRRLILEQNIRRGWYNRPPIAYESLPEAPSHRGDGLSINWRRLPTEHERAINYGAGAHAYDRSGDYLAAAGGAMLPYGPPKWVEGASYEKQNGHSASAGLWRCRVAYHLSPWDGYELPAVCPEGENVWLWTPVLRAALACGYAVESAGAILWPEQHHILGTWAARVWAARRALETIRSDEDFDRWPIFQFRREAVALVKGVYTQTIGMFGNQDMAREIEQRDDDDTRALPRWYRPEWQRTIHAEAVAYAFAVMRKAVDPHGYEPLWARVDTLGFCADDGPGITAERAGLFTTIGKCGAWRYDYTIPMAELLNPRGRDVDSTDGRHRLPTVRRRHE